MNALLLVTLLFTQSDTLSTQPSTLAVETEVAPTTSPPLFSTPRGIGVHFGIGPGSLAVDVRHDKLYAMLSAGVGMAVLSDGRYTPITIWGGTAFLIGQGERHAWYLDLGLIGGVSIQKAEFGYYNQSGRDYFASGGVGFGFGFRYEHMSGLSVGIKLPAFGVSFGRDLNGGDINSGPTRVGYFYIMSLSAMPVLSLGYRF